MVTEWGEGSAAVELAERERLLLRRQMEILGRLGDLLALRDLETGGHSRRIGFYTAGLGHALGLPAEKVRGLALAAPLHDIGKLAIPDAILLKPGPLDPAERETMRRHAEIGHDLLVGAGSELLDLAAEIALSHHERFDGSGYPFGLAGKEIPLGGRIVAIADSFDFLVSDRPYHDAVAPEQAIAGLLAARGEHFDPALLDCFVENLVRILAWGEGSVVDEANDAAVAIRDPDAPGKTI
jgi:putative two-component system response regulator